MNQHALLSSAEQKLLLSFESDLMKQPKQLENVHQLLKQRLELQQVLADFRIENSVVFEVYDKLKKDIWNKNFLINYWLYGLNIFHCENCRRVFYRFDPIGSLNDDREIEQSEIGLSDEVLASVKKQVVHICSHCC